MKFFNSKMAVDTFNLINQGSRYLITAGILLFKISIYIYTIAHWWKFATGQIFKFFISMYRGEGRDGQAVILFE